MILVSTPKNTVSEVFSKKNLEFEVQKKLLCSETNIKECQGQLDDNTEEIDLLVTFYTQKFNHLLENFKEEMKKIHLSNEINYDTIFQKEQSIFLKKFHSLEHEFMKSYEIEYHKIIKAQNNIEYYILEVPKEIQLLIHQNETNANSFQANISTLQSSIRNISIFYSNQINQLKDETSKKIQELTNKSLKRCDKINSDFQLSSRLIKQNNKEFSIFIKNQLTQQKSRINEISIFFSGQKKEVQQIIHIFRNNLMSIKKLFFSIFSSQQQSFITGSEIDFEMKNLLVNVERIRKTQEMRKNQQKEQLLKMNLEYQFFHQLNHQINTIICMEEEKQKLKDNITFLRQDFQHQYDLSLQILISLQDLNVLINRPLKTDDSLNSIEKDIETLLNERNNLALILQNELNQKKTENELRLKKLQNQQQEELNQLQQKLEDEKSQALQKFQVNFQSMFDVHSFHQQKEILLQRIHHEKIVLLNKHQIELNTQSDFILQEFSSLKSFLQEREKILNEKNQKIQNLKSEISQQELFFKNQILATKSAQEKASQEYCNQLAHLHALKITCFTKCKENLQTQFEVCKQKIDQIPIQNIIEEKKNVVNEIQNDECNFQLLLMEKIHNYNKNLSQFAQENDQKNIEISNHLSNITYELNSEILRKKEDVIQIKNKITERGPRKEESQIIDQLEKKLTIITKQWHDEMENFSLMKKMLKSQEKVFNKRFGPSPKIGTIRKSYNGPKGKKPFFL